MIYLVFFSAVVTVFVYRNMRFAEPRPKGGAADADGVRMEATVEMIFEVLQVLGGLAAIVAAVVAVLTYRQQRNSSDERSISHDSK